MPPRKAAAKNVICPACWSQGERAVMKAEKLSVKKPDKDDRFPKTVPQYSLVYRCTGCGKLYKE